jgi:nicotinamide mononucleotide (NMN) deamidase PncC
MAADAMKAFNASVGLAAVEARKDQGHTPGTVLLAAAIGSARHVEPFKFPGDRIRLREYSVISLLDLLRRKLLES